MVLEIIADSVDAAIIAEKNGADRIELCEDLVEGGITPSYGLIELTKKSVSIDVFVMIRPRGGDFLFSEMEFEIMKINIEICKKIGVAGVVIGMLNSDGSIDKERSKTLVNLARPMGVTFHRAFDSTSNYKKALEDIIEIGVDRILTSGQSKSAVNGIEILREIDKASKGKLKIMAGAGITSQNVEFLMANTDITEFHSSAKKIIKSEMDYKNTNLSMGRNEADEFSLYTVDGDEVKRIKNKLTQ